MHSYHRYCIIMLSENTALLGGFVQHRCENVLERHNAAPRRQKSEMFWFPREIVHVSNWWQQNSYDLSISRKTQNYLYKSSKTTCTNHVVGNMCLNVERSLGFVLEGLKNTILWKRARNCSYYLVAFIEQSATVKNRARRERVSWIKLFSFHQKYSILIVCTLKLPSLWQAICNVNYIWQNSLRICWADQRS